MHSIPPKLTAIIDVGSNSFRLIVIEFVAERWFHLVDEIRESVRLAEGMGVDGNLQPPAIERALDTLHMYAAFCESTGITDIRACATAAVRNAHNQQAFIERVLEETGIRVQVLSAREEARFGYLSVVNSMTVENGFIADLGGASLEITHIENRNMKETVSLNIGAVRATEDFLGPTPVDAQAVRHLHEHVVDEIRAVDWFKKTPKLALIGQGGTIRNLARIAQKRTKYGLSELHRYEMGQDAVAETCQKMLDRSLAQIKRIPGMKEDRADIMMGGATVVQALMEASGFDAMEICSQGLREGIFYDRYLYNKANRRFEDVRRSTIYNMINLYPYNMAHAEHVAFLALRIFDQAPADTMICTQDDRDLLWAAGILHDIGVSVDYNDHHKHSFYLILNQGLPGYDHRELLLIALMARYHRKGTPSLRGYSKILDKQDRRKLLQMTACLRLAEQLERGRDGVVRDVRLHTQGRKSFLALEVQGEGVVPLWSVARHADIFKEAFKKNLDVSVATRVAT
jgi:exopolyphosphatase/guanosine-5'-triphosphate,3'-diphosphate pyrophosphatase